MPKNDPDYDWDHWGVVAVCVAFALGVMGVVVAVLVLWG